MVKISNTVWKTCVEIGNRKAEYVQLIQGLLQPKPLQLVPHEQTTCTTKWAEVWLMLFKSGKAPKAVKAGEVGVRNCEQLSVSSTAGQGEPRGQAAADVRSEPQINILLLGGSLALLFHNSYSQIYRCKKGFG